MLAAQLEIPCTQQTKMANIWISLAIIYAALLAGVLSADAPSVTLIEPDLATSSLESTDDSAFDLDKAESKDPAGIPPKLEIIKQIRRLNSDGSYTVGYEADDGTFKIESRDVLGNVKGTYGYVDVNGEIKRVSYTAGTNASAARTTARPAVVTEAPADEEVIQMPKVNKTGFASTTRRPASLSYLTTAQSASTRATVIQPIPKKRIHIPSSSERPTYNHYASTPRQNDFSPTATAIRKNGEPTTTVVYATSVPTNRPPVVIRPTALPGAYKSGEQMARPEKLEITDHVSKVQISSNRDSSTNPTKPVTEVVDEMDNSSSTEEKRAARANFVRRQLVGTTDRDHLDETAEAQQQVIFSQSAGDDSSHVYSSTAGTSRPIFNTTPTRIPSAVLSARSRVAQLQNSINNNSNQPSSSKQQQLQSGGGDKVYGKAQRRRVEPREDDQSTAEPSSENQYVAQQRPVSVQIIAPAQQASEEDKRVYRRPVSYAAGPPVAQPQAYRNREFIRQAPAPDFEYVGGPRQYRIPIPQAYPQQQYQQQAGGYQQRPIYIEQQSGAQPETDAEQQQYLRETTVMTAAARPVAAGNDPDSEYAVQIPRPRGRSYLPFAGQSHHRPHQTPDAEYEQQSQPIPYPQNPYSPYNNRPPLPSQYYQHPDRPLTARDFERLLNLLVIRHQQLQRYQEVNPYLFGGGGGGGYNQFGYQQIPRPPINPYDPRGVAFVRPPLYGEFSDQESSFQQAQPSQSPTADPQSLAQYSGHRLVPRLKQRPQSGPVYPGGVYPGDRPEYTEASSATVAAQQPDESNQQAIEYLPSDIREELLYRMLLLAMQPGDLQNQQTAPQPSVQQPTASDQEASSQLYTAAAADHKPAPGGHKAPTATVASKFRKPVRSVQILGEE